MNSRVILFITLFSFYFNSLVAQRKEEFKSYFRIAGVAYTDKKYAKANQMDVYMPKKGSKSPVVLWIHDGNWISGDKSDVDKKPEYFTSKGYIFISVNHRLSPEASFLGQAQDVATAIVWTYNNIIHYSGDKDKIFVMGYGTGAHLASIVALQERFLKNVSGSRGMMKGVVCVEGAGFDIPAVIDIQEKKFREGCEMAIGKSKKQWIEASPVTHVKADPLIPPFMIVHSGGDTPAERDAKLFANKLAKEKIIKRVEVYPKKNDNSINRDLGKDGDKVGEDIITFFYECLRSPTIGGL